MEPPAEFAAFPLWFVISGNMPVMSPQFHSSSNSGAQAVSEASSGAAAGRRTSAATGAMASFRELSPSSPPAEFQANWMYLSGNLPVASPDVAAERDAYVKRAGRGAGAGAGGKKWVQLIDPVTRQSFMLNSSTGVRRNEDGSTVEPQTGSASASSGLAAAGGGKLPGDWVARVDAESGRTYYFSRQLNKTQWHRPVEVVEGAMVDAMDAQVFDWVEKVDPGSGRTYYYSKHRHTTQWHKPVQTDLATALIDDWEEHVDASTNRTYYYSAARKLTSWTKPGTAGGGGGGGTPRRGGGGGGDETAPMLRGADGDGAADDLPALPSGAAPPTARDAASLLERELTENAAKYDMKGYMMKRGGGTRLFGRKNWLKRYFVLTAGQLAYFKDEKSYEAGQPPLKSAWMTVSKYALEDLEGEDFRLVPYEEEAVERDRLFELRALSAEDKQQWIAAVQAATAALNAAAGTV